MKQYNDKRSRRHIPNRELSGKYTKSKEIVNVYILKSIYTSWFDNDSIESLSLTVVEPISHNNHLIWTNKEHIKIDKCTRKTFNKALTYFDSEQEYNDIESLRFMWHMYKAKAIAELKSSL